MKQKDTLIIVILLFIFVLIWIGESVYHSAVSSTISEDVSQEILPIAPSFDTKTVEKLKAREKISPSFDLKNAVAPPIVLPISSASANASAEGKLSL